MIDKSLFLYWYPKIEGKLNTPKSIIVKITPGISNIINDIVIKLNENNISFPIFLKTDTYSAKWYWSKTCFVENITTLRSNIEYLSTLSEEDDSRPIDALIGKEYLTLESDFLAFDGMPVGKERRYFIENKRVLCHHPYWETEDIEFFNEDYPKNWKNLLTKLNTEDENEIVILSGMAERFAELINDDEYFSVDFAKDISGKWWVIDAAEGVKSYHNEDCEIFKLKQ